MCTPKDYMLRTARSGRIIEKQIGRRLSRDEIKNIYNQVIFNSGPLEYGVVEIDSNLYKV